ncbi:aspartate aminotransferase family protein [Mesorhizobium australicum]|uniref:aspartate aminotransferase family protein n=1 Tax=Mesorhizobium australicum TaxID=536018 RepID=UPI00333D10DF
MATRSNEEVRQKTPALSKSEKAFARALLVFPDGTSRVTIERDPIPKYMERGEGAYLFDVDGNRYLDVNGNFTSLIHGHAFKPVVDAVHLQLASGSCFANPTQVEIELASVLCERIPNVDRVRFVNSGTEAVMFAIKAARAFTGKAGIAKFEGAYHGAYDWVEVSQSATPENWGPADDPISVPFYRGMPESVLQETLVLRFNDTVLLEKNLTAHARRIAAVLIDPMPSQVGLIAPKPDFLEALHRLCRHHGVLIIADEVLNLRQGYHGASARYGLKPDLITMGKIIGGGLPIGAIGGREEVMQVFSAKSGRPLLPQGGTFSANPLSIVAGITAMRALDKAAFARLDGLGDRLCANLTDIIAQRDAPFAVTGAGSLFRIHPTRRKPREFRDMATNPAQNAVLRTLSRFFSRHGVILPNGATACLSTPMGETEVDTISDLFRVFLQEHEADINKMEKPE